MNKIEGETGGPFARRLRELLAEATDALGDDQIKSLRERVLSLRAELIPDGSDEDAVDASLNNQSQNLLVFYDQWLQGNREYSRNYLPRDLRG